MENVEANNTMENESEAEEEGVDGHKTIFSFQCQVPGHTIYDNRHHQDTDWDPIAIEIVASNIYLKGLF